MSSPHYSSMKGSEALSRPGLLLTCSSSIRFALINVVLPGEYEKCKLTLTLDDALDPSGQVEHLARDNWQFTMNPGSRADSLMRTSCFARKYQEISQA